MREPNIGKRVKYTMGYGRPEAHGKVGTIIAIHRAGRDVLVEFDENVNGHSGDDGEGKDRHCWYIPLEFLEFQKQFKTHKCIIQRQTFTDT